MTDFSESEEDLSSDDPEQEGAALDVRSAAKKRARISLKKKHTQRTGHKQKKEEKGHDDDDPMFVFALPR